MANAKTTATTKTTTKATTKATVEKPEEKEVKVENQTVVDPMIQMMEMMKTMNSQLSTLTQELSATKAELADTKAQLDETKNLPVATLESTVEDGSTSIINNIAPIQEAPMNVVYQNTGMPSLAEQYIASMANRKADKEVTIVHNREVLGGASTHIQLSTVTIDFHTLGETRTLSWGQFEELASKYRGFFNREIILVADENRDVAESLKLPCVKRPDGAVLTRTQLMNLNKMDVNQLTALYNSLSKEDKKFMLNYWLGQCYTREPGFYDRYKIETLNSLSQNGTFDALLAFMNGQAINSNRNNQANKMINGMPVSAEFNNLIGKA